MNSREKTTDPRRAEKGKGKCEKYIKQFRACQQCRSDAVGLLTGKSRGIFDLLKERKGCNGLIYLA